VLKNVKCCEKSFAEELKIDSKITAILTQRKGSQRARSRAFFLILHLPDRWKYSDTEIPAL